MINKTNIKSQISKIRYKGQTLFEVVVAVGLVAVVMVGILSLSTVSVRNSSFSRNNVLATKYAQEATEWIRGERDKGWNTFITHMSTNCLGSLSWGSSCSIDSTFSRSVDFTCKYYNLTTGNISSSSCASANVVDVEVVVSWSGSQGVHQVKSLSSLTAWR